MSSRKWIVPFTKRKYSGPDQVSFLYSMDLPEGKIWISDNHKTAIWCWGQSDLIEKEEFSFLHIDAHYDCDDKGLEQFPKNWKSLSYEELYTLKLDSVLPLIRWDNYIPLFFKTDGIRIKKSVAVTHHIGKKIAFDLEIAPWDLAKKLDDILLSEKKWIINLDFDYFYSRTFKDAPLFSDQFIKYFFNILKLTFEEKKVHSFTVALSPECCGSWENAEKILDLFCEVFSFDNPLNARS